MNEEGKKLAMALRSAYLTMHRRADSYFTQHGVTTDQFVLLHILAQEGGVTQQRLVERASSDPSTVRVMLVLLEGRCLVKRERHPVDGRARSVSLTERGLKVYQKLQAASEPFLAELLADYRPEEVQVLLGLLHRIPPAMTTRKARRARRQPTLTPGSP